MREHDETRRRLLVAIIGFSGLLATGSGAGLIRAGRAWAQEAGNELATLARRLFPHEGISDDVYAEVMDSVLAASAEDPALDEALAAADAALDDDWMAAAPDAQVRALTALEDAPWFAAIAGAVRARFYTHPAVWKHIGYPGSSLEFGGYLERGFDDIDWLPEDA